jgi:hypothetical protein
MPHRSPSLLNHNLEDYGSSQSKYRISFQNTFPILFDAKYMDQTANTKGTAAKREKHASKVSQSEVIKKLMHHQYLELMAVYDIEYFQEIVIP